MNILLFDHPEIRRSLLPLTFTRAVADIRLGIMTISEKWAYEFNHSVSCFTQDYLSTKYPAVMQEDNLYINGALCPDQQLLNSIANLSYGQGLKQGEITIAFRSGPFGSPDELAGVLEQCEDYENPTILIRNTWQLFLLAPTRRLSETCTICSEIHTLSIYAVRVGSGESKRWSRGTRPGKYFPMSATKSNDCNRPWPTSARKRYAPKGLPWRRARRYCASMTRS